MIPFHAKKSLGQHFLKNPHVARAMVAAGGVAQGDTVLEIGPGTGALTRELLAAGATVLGVEADARAVETLEEQYREAIARGQLVVHHADVRAWNPADAGLAEHSYKLVANIPYYLSGMLMRRFLGTVPQPSLLVFLVQKEVAERIAREPKESLLSLSVKVYGTPRYIRTVERGNFVPPPSVDSAILLVERISRSRFEKLPERFFFELLALGFRSRRKQLLGNLAARYRREELMRIFTALGFPQDIRGEDLTIERWVEFAEALFNTRYSTP